MKICEICSSKKRLNNVNSFTISGRVGEPTTVTLELTTLLDDIEFYE